MIEKEIKLFKENAVGMSENISKKENTIEELKDEVLNNINLIRLRKIHSDLKRKLWKLRMKIMN